MFLEVQQSSLHHQQVNPKKSKKFDFMDYTYDISIQFLKMLIFFEFMTFYIHFIKEKLKMQENLHVIYKITLPEWT